MKRDQWRRIMAAALLILIFSGCATQGEVNGGGTIVGNPVRPLSPDDYHNDLLVDKNGDPILLSRFFQDLSLQFLFLLKNPFYLYFNVRSGVEGKQEPICKD